MLLYVCPHCGHEMETTLDAPGPKKSDWPAKPLPEFRHLCAECGRFAIPAMFYGADDWAKNCYAMFSGCPLAYECVAFGQYDADCEQGQVMQKCLMLINIRLQILDRMIRDKRDDI